MKTKQDWMKYAEELEAAIRAITYRAAWDGGKIVAYHRDGADLRPYAPILEDVWDNAPREEDPGIQAGIALPFAENH